MDREKVWSRVGQHGGAVLAVVGTLLYGFARAAHDGFYSGLAVVPEEAGITQTLILGRAALYAVAATPFLLLIASAARWSLAHPLLASRPRVVAVVTTVATALILLLAAVFAAGPGYLVAILRDVPLGLMTVITIFLVSFGSTVTAVARGSRRGHIDQLNLLFALAALVTSSLLVSFFWGRALAGLAERGLPIGPRTFQLLVARAEPVCVGGLEGRESPLGRRGPFMYLGGAGGTIVLFDYRRVRSGGRTIRVASDRVVIEWAIPVKKRPPGYELPRGPYRCRQIPRS